MFTHEFKKMQNILYDRIQIFKIEIKLQRKFEKKMSINLIMQSTTIVFFIPTFYLTLILMFFHFIFILKIQIQILIFQKPFVLPWLSLL
jgi:hypothetical protein